jgi:Ohr subfamily peroxiredoxin
MIKPMSIEVIYTAESTATGGGRDGHVKSSNDRIDLDTRPPKEMGGSGEGTNPEELFSAGYAACFLGALRLVAGKAKVKLDDAAGITARIGFGKDSDGGYGLTADLVGYLPGLEQRVADDLMHQAHQVCPYSKATRGNIDVTLAAKV